MGYKMTSALLFGWRVMGSDYYSSSRHQGSLIEQPKESSLKGIVHKKDDKDIP